METDQRYIATVDIETEREDLGVQKIAFTNDPAIIIKGVAFSAERPAPNTSTDEKKMRIIAPVLVPAEVYRRETKPNAKDAHTIIFTAEEIPLIMADFMQRLNNADPKFKNTHRDTGTSPAYILESWIVEDPATDKANTVYGLNLEAGSWVVIIQITEKSYYDKLVKEGATGLSIEGFLGHKLELSIENQIKMAEEGQTVKTSLPDGVYTDADGKKITVKDGEIIANAEELEDEAGKDGDKGEEVAMSNEELEDGSNLEYEGDLTVGSKTSSKDGEYKTKSGKTIVVKDGVISEIKEAAAVTLEDVPAPATETPADCYTKAEVDKMLKDLRAEFAAQLAEAALAAEEVAEAKPAGEQVEMSRHEAVLSNRERLRSFMTGRKS